MNLDSFGGRRFVLAILTLLLCSLMRAFGVLSDGGYVTIIMGSVAAYIAAGTFEKHSEIRADVQKTVAAAQVEAAPSGVVQQVTQ